MTYSYLATFNPITGPRYLVNGPSGVLETSDEVLAGWVATGLNYAGSPGSLGDWGYERVRQYPQFGNKLNLFAVSDVAGVTVGFTDDEGFAQAIVDAMTDYPNERPE